VNLILTASVVMAAESINGWAAQNWERFADQNYFDERGVFMSIIVGAPMLIFAAFVLVCYAAEDFNFEIQCFGNILRRQTVSFRAVAF
jgi:transmembrane protein 18